MSCCSGSYNDTAASLAAVGMCRRGSLRQREGSSQLGKGVVPGDAQATRSGLHSVHTILPPRLILTSSFTQRTLPPPT